MRKKAETIRERKKEREGDRDRDKQTVENRRDHGKMGKYLRYADCGGRFHLPRAGDGEKLRRKF